jgi:putative FmdB family regulatory protein
VPIYEYQCEACAERFEIKQGMKDDPLTACPRCGKRVQRLISSPAIMFKGSGWYVTDYSDKLKPSPGNEPLPSTAADKKESAPSTSEQTTSTAPSTPAPGAVPTPASAPANTTSSTSNTATTAPSPPPQPIAGKDKVR